MKYDFKKLTLKNQLYILFCLFVVLTSVNFFVINHLLDQVDITRKKAETAQAIPNKIAAIQNDFEQFSNTDESSKSVFQKHINQTDNIFRLFLNGGKLPDFDDYIEPAESKTRQDLNTILLLWDSIQSDANILRFSPHTLDTTIQEVVEIPNYDSLNTTRQELVSKIIQVDNPEVVKAKHFIAENQDDLLVRVNQFVSNIEAQHKLSKELLIYGILLVVALNFIVFALLLLAIRKIILNPINQLDTLTQKVLEGDFDSNLEFEWQNEVSEVAVKVNKIAVSLKNATEFVKKVGKGELDTTFKHQETSLVNENGLEAALLTMRDQLKDVEKKDEVRTWSTSGLAKFVDILRSSNDNVTDLCDQIISNLVDYTHSNQGGLYLLNQEDDENTFLELISLYAFNSKKYDTKVYRLGESLVGQTFLERKTTYLLEIPNDYITISSGLGGANPKAILLVPLQVNEEIFGILELASFEEYKDFEIEFVEKLGESIASTISSVKNNQRTKRLLSESQELTEQMQAQEEEMRQNMEELSATQEEMARKEVEISGQLTAINSSLGTVEYLADGKIIKTNALFSDSMGYESGTLIDVYFSAIYADNNDVWSTLKKGINVDETLQFKKKNGEIISLKSSLTPIKGDQGEIIKIVQLITQFGVKEQIDSSEELKGLEDVEQALKQNLEALEITQEQLDRKTKLIDENINFINRHVKAVTIDGDNSIQDANDAFLTFIGKTMRDIVGRSIDLFFDQKIIEALKNKESTVGEAKVNDLIINNINLIYADHQKEPKSHTFLIWV